MSDRVIVHLGIPYTSGISVMTNHAADRTALDFNRRDECNRQRVCVINRLSNTVAGYCFNLLLADALNGKDCPDGELPKWFCMLHSDVVPLGDYWLDRLIDAAEDSGADVVHAPCNLKDFRGLTSTAVGNLDDEWTAHRRINLHELHRLPDPFEVTDVTKLWEADEPGCIGRAFSGQRICLMPNTGCMLIRLGPWMRFFPGFEQRSRMLCRQRDDGRWEWKAQLSPEDWRFGRWCVNVRCDERPHGLKVVGTKSVSTAHLGVYAWTTTEPWGKEKCDVQFLSVIKEMHDAAEKQNPVARVSSTVKRPATADEDLVFA